MAAIRVNGDIDREFVSEYVLTIKCFKRKTKAYSLQKTYNKQDPSERQVVIRVLDIDDNLPRFVDENITLGKTESTGVTNYNNNKARILTRLKIGKKVKTLKISKYSL